jgi:hypothetical protein
VSKRVIGYEGEGKHRRPIYEDLGPARAGDVSGLAAAGRLSALDIRGTDRPEGAGPVERRQITAAEMDARRDDRPALNSPEHLQQSRMNGGARTSAIHAAHRAAQAPEEEAMAVTHQDINVVIEARSPLARLAEAAQEAERARAVREMADGHWRSAAADLEAAWASVNAILSTPQAELDAMGESIESWAQQVRVDVDPETVAAVLDGTGRPRQPKPGGDAKRAAGADERARLVLAALERHGGDTRKAGLELGLRGNVVGRIASSARARQIAAESAAAEAQA